MAIAPASNVTHEHLRAAQESLAIGNTTRQRVLAHEALVRGINIRDSRVEAEASLILSQAYVFESGMQLGYRFSKRAFELFVRQSDAAGQAEALAVASYTASALGMNDEAVRLANQGISLRANIDSPAAQVVGLNYLGVASFWARDFGTACGVLEASVSISDSESNLVAGGFQPLVNLCFSEVLRILDGDDRCSMDLSVLEDCVARARTAARKSGRGGLNHADSAIGLLLLDLCACFLSSKSGHLQETDSLFMACFHRTTRLPRTSWLQSIAWWARLERAKAYRDFDKAVVSAQAMAEYARQGEHTQLQGLAHSFESKLRTHAYH